MSCATALTIDFWDVGQGDCTVIHLPDGRFLLIDVGRRGCPVVDWLADRQPSAEIAAVVLTHNDSDHAGSLPSILDRFRGRIGRLWMLVDRPSTKEPFQKTFRRAEEAERRDGLEITRLEKGAQIWSQGDLCLKVSFPTFTANVGARRPNDTSGLLILCHGDRPLCVWPGDLPTSTIAAHLPEGRPGLLHGPHHGGPTDFLTRKVTRGFRESVRRVAGNYGFISVGTKNSYHHPRPGYLALLANLGCRVVCSQITTACDRLHWKTDTPVFDGTGALGLRSPRSGTPCRGAWRVRVVDGELEPDEFTDRHLAKVAELRRPQCLKGRGWKRGCPLPW